MYFVVKHSSPSFSSQNLMCTERVLKTVTKNNDRDQTHASCDNSWKRGWVFW